MDNIRYTIYDIGTGQSLEVGETQADAISIMMANLPANHAMIPLEYGDEDWYFVNGKPVPRPAPPDLAMRWFGVVLPDVDALNPLELEIKSTYVNGSFNVTAPRVVFAQPGIYEVTLKQAWPLRSVTVTLEVTAVPEGISLPEGFVITPDINDFRATFITALYGESEAVARAVLGNPDDTTRQRWLLKRAIYDRALAGTLSASDQVALEQAVKYSGTSTADELALIGQKVAFENWVVMRTEGIRQEAERRMLAAATCDDVLQAVDWAYAESATAVAEAQTL
ncbi:hypothetical protein AB9F29_20325 [Falsihalocynthiibacter sp. S25ZX9]|uniref:hypothetical protein n=1 Tax=Falsihalocynthiibacter sp. S25ZX9 TaxID=3240870 RepID=UPI00350EC0D5